MLTHPINKALSYSANHCRTKLYGPIQVQKETNSHIIVVLVQFLFFHPNQSQQQIRRSPPRVKSPGSFFCGQLVLTSENVIALFYWPQLLHSSIRCRIPPMEAPSVILKADRFH